MTEHGPASTRYGAPVTADEALAEAEAEADDEQWSSWYARTGSRYHTRRGLRPAGVIARRDAVPLPVR